MSEPKPEKWPCEQCKQTWPTYESYYNHNCQPSYVILKPGAIQITREQLREAIKVSMNRYWSISTDAPWSLLERELFDKEPSDD